MAKSIQICFVSVLLLHITYAYIAGIVEYKVDTSETDPNKTIEKNFNEYQTQIEQLKTQSVDIAVFPEYGLTGRVEDPTNYAISVPNAGELLPNNILRTISDAAKTNSMYLVVNLLEYYVNSTNNNVTEYYNTNVVFDKQGALVAKYRKINLFHEPKLTAGTSICTFTATDLGATFGVFTSQDILFSNPSKTISTVNAILFPNAWPVTVPFYNTLSIQHAYVKSKGVTLISANLNDINNGYSGSGIIQSDGSFLISRITGIDGTSIQYKDVSATSRSGTTGTSRALPGEGSLQELENLVYTKSTNFKKYTVKNLDQSTTDVSLSECNNQFCCLLTASLNTDSISQTGVQYKLIVYSGKDTTIINEERSVKYCALVSCENNDESKCGVPNESFSEDFASLSISANFSSTDNPLPVSLNGKFLPLNNFDYSYSIKNSQNTEHRMNIASVTPNLNVIGFVSTEPNGAKGIEFSIMLMLASFILHYVIKM